MIRHLKKIKMRHPPGDEIYRKDNVSMFEVQQVTPTAVHYYALPRLCLRGPFNLIEHPGCSQRVENVASGMTVC